MKKLLFLSALIAGSLSINTASAQIGVHLNINLGSRPVYAPVPPPPPVNDEYYYLPDAEAYYSVPEQVYYYQNEGRWITSPRLTGRFYGYDYNRLRHVAINEPRPYLRNDFYRSRYNNPQFYAHNNGDFRNQDRGRSFDRGPQNDRRFDNGNFRGGRDFDRRDNGNRNGWNRP